MAQPILPTEKKIHMGVKLVSTDGIDLPFKPFVLIPEDQFALFESWLWTAKAVRPAQLDQVVAAGRLGREAAGELRPGAQFILHSGNLILADRAPLSQVDSRFQGVRPRAQQPCCSGSDQLS